jgi:hypothetical protein
MLSFVYANRGEENPMSHRVSAFAAGQDVYYGSQVWTVQLSADGGSIIARNGHRKGVDNRDLRAVTDDDAFRGAPYLGLPNVTR